MLASEELSLREYPPPVRPEVPTQQIQGWYYLVFGLWVAIGIATFQSPTRPWIGLHHFWLARAIGLLVAVVGVALIRASRLERSIPAAIGVPVVLAFVLAVLELTAIANEALPSPFLLDVGMEVGFLVWWACVFTFGGRTVGGNRSVLEG